MVRVTGGFITLCQRIWCSTDGLNFVAWHWNECLSCLDHMDCLHGISNNKAVEGANSRKVKSEYLLLLMCGCSILQIHWMTAMLDKGTFDAVFGETLTNSPDNLAVSNARVASFGLLGFLSR